MMPPTPTSDGPPTPQFRILVTGSRTWDDLTVISDALDAFKGRNTLVTGACPKGADYLAEMYALGLGWEIERHPAAWSKYGKRAGFLRNKEMVELGADVCLAFIRDESKGASMCADLADLAEREGINVYRFIYVPKCRACYAVLTVPDDSELCDSCFMRAFAESG